MHILNLKLFLAKDWVLERPVFTPVLVRLLQAQAVPEEGARPHLAPSCRLHPRTAPGKCSRQILLSDIKSLPTNIVSNFH